MDWFVIDLGVHSVQPVTSQRQTICTVISDYMPDFGIRSLSLRITIHMTDHPGKSCSVTPA